jgi:hypothetical protein
MVGGVSARECSDACGVRQSAGVASTVRGDGERVEMVKIWRSPTAGAMGLSVWWGRGELNPHALSGTRT